MLADWNEQLQLPRLNGYGISEDDFPMIVANSRGNSMQTSPIVLMDEEINSILIEALNNENSFYQFFRILDKLSQRQNSLFLIH